MPEYRVVNVSRVALVWTTTCVVACGPGSSAPKVQETTTAPHTPVVTAAPVDAAVPDAPPPPRLACEPGTHITQAPPPDPTWACVRDDGTRHGPFQTEFPDGATAITGTFVDGKLDGAWQKNHPGGQPAEIGTYAKGLKTGHWKQLAASGATLGEYDLKDGTGVEKRWYESGTIYSEVTVASGVEHGPWKLYLPDGTIIGAGRYFKGKLDGKHEFGTKNTLRIEETLSGGVPIGKRTIWQFWLLLAEENYDKRGRLDGTYTVWRNKKTPRFKGDYDHGKRIGPWVWNDRDNNVEREGTYVDGKRDGVWNEYSEKKLTFTGTYAKGRPDGTFIYYDRNGNELGRFDIKDGTGTMLTYFSNKKVSTKEHVYHGVRDGTYQELTVRGKVIVEGHYASGNRHGSWKEWTLDGVPLLDASYRRGRPHGKVKKFVDGKPSVESNFVDGKAEGAYTEFRASGKPSVTGQFVDDKKDGTWTYYDANGNATLVATYKAGVLEGPWKQLTNGSVLEGAMAHGRRSGAWTLTDKAGAVRKLSYE